MGLLKNKVIVSEEFASKKYYIKKIIKKKICNISLQLLT
jgi:hypothetical protein